MDAKAAVEAMRKDKDEWLKRSPHSPIPPHDRAAFKGLSYFPYDPAFAARARVDRAQGHKHVSIGTSTGDVREYHEACQLVFVVDGKEQRLTGYVSHGREEELFIPFRDATSGVESYGAARYLEIPAPEGDEAIVDFNLAYNPYCAYSEAYSCPLPPRENWLAVAIRAGEKSYHG